MKKIEIAKQKQKNVKQTFVCKQKNVNKQTRLEAKWEKNENQ